MEEWTDWGAYYYAGFCAQARSKDRGPDLGSTWVRGKVLLDRK